MRVIMIGIGFLLPVFLYCQNQRDSLNAKILTFQIDTFKWEFVENKVRGDNDETDFGYTYGKDYVHQNEMQLVFVTNQFEFIFERTAFDPENFDEYQELMHYTSNSIVLEDCLDSISLRGKRAFSLMNNQGDEKLINGYKYFKLDKYLNVKQGYVVFNQKFKRYSPLEVIEMEKGEILIITLLFYQEDQSSSSKMLKMNLVVKQV